MKYIKIPIYEPGEELTIYKRTEIVLGFLWATPGDKIKILKRNKLNYCIQLFDLKQNKWLDAEFYITLGVDNV